MYTSNVRSLRADLATALRRAEGGEATIVTARGRPIAALAPLDSLGQGAPTHDQLVATGAVLAARRPGRWRAGEPVRIWAGTRIDQALRELRG